MAGYPLVLIGSGIFILDERFVDKQFNPEGSSDPSGIVAGAIVDSVPQFIILGVQIGKGTTGSYGIASPAFRVRWHIMLRGREVLPSP